MKVDDIWHEFTRLVAIKLSFQAFQASVFKNCFEKKSFFSLKQLIIGKCHVLKLRLQEHI